MIVLVTQTTHPVQARTPPPQTTSVQSITDTSLKGQRITSPTVFASPIFVSLDDDSSAKKSFKYTPIFIHDLPSDQNYKRQTLYPSFPTLRYRLYPISLHSPSCPSPL